MLGGGRTVAEVQRSQVRPWTVWIVTLNVLAGLLLAYLLYSIRGLLTVLLIAVFLTVAVNPVVEWLQRHRFTRGWAIFTVVLGFVLLFALLILSFVPMFSTQGRNLVDAFPAMMGRLQTSKPFYWAQEHFHLRERLNTVVESHGGAMAAFALGLARSVVTGVFGFGTALVLSVFMLIFGKDVVESGLDLLGTRRRKLYAPVLERIRTTVGRYVLGTVFVALIGGTVITVTLAIMGVPYFMPLGFAMVIAGLVPYLGPTIGAVLIVSVTLATAGWVEALVMTVVFLGYQFAEGNLLQPVVQRRAIHLNPLVVVISMLIGASLGGVLGAVLALPVVGTIKAILQDSRTRKRDAADPKGPE
jgi:predicted PurR-regulated permease PerM